MNWTHLLAGLAGSLVGGLVTHHFNILSGIQRALTIPQRDRAKVDEVIGKIEPRRLQVILPPDALEQLWNNGLAGKVAEAAANAARTEIARAAGGAEADRTATTNPLYPTASSGTIARTGA